MVKKVPAVSFGFMFASGKNYKGADIEVSISEEGIITLRDSHTYEKFLELPVAEWTYFEEFTDFLNSFAGNVGYAMREED